MEGTPAKLVGSPGDGVRNIATLVNITRIHNAVGASSAMRHSLALARDYAARREAFGRRLADHPMHAETLANLQVEFQAAFHLTFRSIELLGKEEYGKATSDELAVLRLLTPLAKLYTAKQSVAAASEVLESFGGAGYVEDTGLPRLLRDAQVLPIWEGTTNILSLDALRAIERQDAFGPFWEEMERRLAQVTLDELSSDVAAVREAGSRIRAYLPMALAEGPEFQQAGARAFAFSLARTFAAGLLLEQAQWSARNKDDARDVAAAHRWRRQELAPLVAPDADHRRETQALAADVALEVSDNVMR
jgi:hypothetical protein